MTDDRIRRYVELAVELSAATPLDPIEFMRMLLHVRDAAQAVIAALHSDGADSATKVRFSAEVLRLYVDDAIRAVAVSPNASDPVAVKEANEAAGRVVNYAVALRDIYRHTYG